MLTRLVRGVLASVLLGVMVVATAGEAAAEGGGCPDGTTPVKKPVTITHDDGRKTVEMVDSCEGSEADESGGSGSSGSSSGEQVCYFEGQQLESCYTTGGAWWNGSCFVGAPMASMSGEPGPDGEAPEEGAWHMCHLPPGGGTAPAMCSVGTGEVALACVWIPAGSSPLRNPVDVAWMAIASLTLSPIEVGIVPKTGEDRFGLVGLPTWMWVAGPGDSSWGPVSASASDGPVSVSITARARQVLWDMGDGNVVVCGKGVPYDPVYGIAESPNCGHRYERTSVDEPDQAYLVTATTQWVVEWSGGGMTGVIEFDLVSDPVPVRVGEMQVLLQ